MKLIVTGSTGFLGRAICSTLQDKHELTRLSREEKTGIRADISEAVQPLPAADMVIHCAGKAHVVPTTEKEKEDFFRINVKGTENLLTALENSLPDTFVFISSVAVYGVECGISISEDAPLNGQTHYALSKIQAEELVNAWGQKKGVNIVILRLPLITGTNPPGNLRALYKAIKRGYYFRIGSGQAKKSMVGAPDIAELLPTLLEKNGIYNLTDGRHPSVIEVDTHIAALLGRKVRGIPSNFMGLVAKIGDLLPSFPLNSLRLKKLDMTLTFDDTKARIELGWDPKPALSWLKFVFE